MESKSLYAALLITIGFIGYAFIYHMNIKQFEFLFQTKLINLASNLSLNSEQISTRPSSTKPRYIYIDMGTNDADSIMSFFGMSQRGYPSLLNQTFIQDKEWMVYAFEANPRFNNDIKAVTEKVVAKYPQVKFKLYTETAIWTYNGQIKFYLDTVNVGGNFWGSSLKDTHVDVINSKKKSVNVTCVDIVEFFKQFNQEDLIVAKMDVEGAEYELLTHMIVNNVLGLIDYLGVEYHNGVLQRTPDSLITSENMLDFIVQKFNIKLIKWV